MSESSVRDFIEFSPALHAALRVEAFSLQDRAKESGMFYNDGGKLQYHVRVETPDPVFAKALQQAIGGVQGEIRVALQYASGVPFNCSHVYASGNAAADMPSEKDLDKALADTFPASDPIALHVDTPEKQTKSGEAPAAGHEPARGRPGEDRSSSSCDTRSAEVGTRPAGKRNADGQSGA